tara:strand:- start:22897 stop:24030 length:1134 start_codon:yes stop_codon:yes gene_type:complete
MQNKISEELSLLKTKNYWRNLDKQIFFSFFLLFALGIFFSFSSTSFLADERLNKEYYFFFQKHLIYALFSFFVMIFISLINTKLINKVLIPIFIIFLICMILIPFFGVEVKGAKRWLNFYIFRFQPVEFIKPFFILIIAQLISSNWIKNINLSYLLSFICLSFLILLLLIQPDLGQTVLIICTWISLIFVSGVNIYSLFLLFGFVTTLLILLVYFSPDKFNYIVLRISSFLDPSKAENFQSRKATDAIREGSLKGRGMGEGILKENVPEAHTDFIIAVISEEFGSLISISIILIFLFISFRVVKRIINFNQSFYKLALSGLISLIIFQTFIHVGVNANLLPTTGMTLPFLSYGGSSLISSGIIAGIILNYTSLGLRE